MITRNAHLRTITEAFAYHPVCAILGPRQCGKTTLARQFAKQFTSPMMPCHFFDLENQA